MRADGMCSENIPHACARFCHAGREKLLNILFCFMLTKPTLQYIWKSESNHFQRLCKNEEIEENFDIIRKELMIALFCMIPLSIIVW